jgi:hypothetical protein
MDYVSVAILKITNNEADKIDYLTLDEGTSDSVYTLCSNLVDYYKNFLKKRKINKLTATDEVEFMLNQIKNDILSIYDKNMSIEDDTAISQAVIDNDEASRY